MSKTWVLLILLLLPQEDEADKALEQFKTAVKKAKQDADLVSAIEELGKTRHAKVLAELKKWPTGHPLAEVRIAAANQIGKYKGDKDAAEVLISAATAQKDMKVAAKCVAAAGETKVKAIASKLAALFKHKDIDLAHEAIDASAKIKSKDSVEPLIAVVKDLESVTGTGGLGAPQLGDDERTKRKNALLEPALKALAAICGEKWTTGKEWQIWWGKHKATFKEPD